MIDTSKYEGHTEGPWESWSDYIMKKGNSWQEPIAEMDFNFNEADAKLIADAPLLLAEVKRLKKLALEAYQIPINYKRAKDLNRITELLMEMIE